MRLTIKARQEVTKATARQYRGTSKKEKGKILDQFIATTGYSRWYARLVLPHEGRRVQTDKQVKLRGRSHRKLVRRRDPIISLGFKRVSKKRPCRICGKARFDHSKPVTASSALRLALKM